MIHPPAGSRSFSPWALAARAAVLSIALWAASSGVSTQVVFAQALDDTPASVREALARRQSGDLDGAISVLEQALRATVPEGGESEPAAETAVRDVLGSLYLEVDRPADAREVLAPLIASPAPDPLTLFNAARASLALGEARQAEPLLRASVEASPRSRAALLLFELLAGEERWQEAVAVLTPLAEGEAAERIEEADPALAAEVALQYGLALAATGEHARAVVALERVARLEPQRREGWERLGESLLALERYDDAQQALARAQELAEAEHRSQVAARRRLGSDGGIEELLGRAAAAQAGGDLAGALAAVVEAVRSAPEDPRPRIVEIRLLTGAGRRQEALARADELVERTSGLAEALYLRGMLRRAEGDGEGAEADLRLALEREPSHLAALSGLAAVLIDRGERSEAAALLERALSLRPSDPLALRVRQRLAPPG